ncbi:MAG: hypothetical protein AAGG08_02735 [Actinomycetota bacterium]
MRLADLDHLARRQFGVVHRNQTGWQRSTWYRALRSGSLIPVHPSVARLVGSSESEQQRICAAVLAVPGAVASHRSAAVLWDFVPSRPNEVVHLTTPASNARRDVLVGVVCHRPDDRLDVRPVMRHGIPATPAIRTLLDLGITDRRLVREAVGRSIRDEILTIGDLETGLARLARQGRTGVFALRRAIEAWAIDGRPADSELEVAFTELCARAGLPAVVHHHRIGRWEVDFRFVGTAIVVECDEWATHGRDRTQFERNRRKDDDLRAAGWVPVRLTYRAIVRQPADTVRRLRRLLDRWADLPVPDERH